MPIPEYYALLMLNYMIYFREDKLVEKLISKIHLMSANVKPALAKKLVL